MQNKRREEKGCISTYTNCIKYDGPDIPCLGIKSGDYINCIVAVLVDKICEVTAPQDLSSISIQCLLDNFSGLDEPLSKTIVTYLQLLIDNQCTIKRLIDAINERIDEINDDDTLVLDLKCLSLTDGQGNTTYTVETVLQTLINEVCNHKSLIASINGTLVNLQGQITTLAGNIYTEPQVTSCTYSGTKPLSQAFLFLSSDYCTYKPKVGSAADIATAIGRQPSSLATQFATDSNFIQQPSSLAHSENNQWLTIQDLINRIAAIEDCACKVDCSSIKLGWQVNDNEDGDGVTLDFSGDYGNIIPALFTDCGSTVTFVDKNKKQKTYVLKLKQEYTSVEYDLSMLDLTGLITVKVCAQLCNGTQQCCKCAEAEHMVVNGTCNSCAVTISGSTGQTSITYTHGSNMATIYAKVGDVVYLPIDAFNITYITMSGDAVPDTSCLTITAASNTCWEFQWEIPADEGDVFDNVLKDAVYVGILLDGTTHTFQSNVEYIRDAPEVINRIQATPSLQNVVTPRCYNQELVRRSGVSGDSVLLNFLRVEVPANLGKPELLIDNKIPEGNRYFKMTVPAVKISDSSCNCSGYTSNLNPEA